MCTSRLHEVMRNTEAGTVVVRDLDGVEHAVSLLAFDGDEPTAGDWLVVHSGFALSRAEPDEVAATLAEWESMKENMP